MYIQAHSLASIQNFPTAPHRADRTAHQAGSWFYDAMIPHRGACDDHWVDATAPRGVVPSHLRELVSFNDS
jgi:hypothetical protein